LPFCHDFDIVALEMVKEEVHTMYVITDDCISCGTCADECAVGAISEGDGKYVIDTDTCAECGACTDACASNAIIEE
jgi:ferredoxin